VIRGILFDLFGTLIEVEQAALPEMVIDGRLVHSTMGRWAGLVDELLPDVGVDAFARALVDASAELAVVRRTTHEEPPSRERFRRAILRVGGSLAAAAAIAPVLSRAHMRAIADATRCPTEHRGVLEWAVRRGPVAVVSNFDDTGTAYAILARHGILERVQSVVVSAAVGLRKPHRVLVDLALRDLALAPSDALFVGDDPTDDLGAARAAGMDAAWIDKAGRGLPDGIPPPRFTLRAIGELPLLLDAP
jgi:FMN phosphatase YigB (HAD superfamily)